MSVAESRGFRLRNRATRDSVFFGRRVIYCGRMLFGDTDPDWYDPDLAELEVLSNGVLDLIESEHLDEAERICLELKRRFPDQIDWIEHSAALTVARGQIEQAIEQYEQCLAHINRHPDGFDSDSRAWYRSQIDRLSQRTKAGACARDRKDV